MQVELPLEFWVGFKYGVLVAVAVMAVVAWSVVLVFEWFQWRRSRNG